MLAVLAVLAYPVFGHAAINIYRVNVDSPVSDVEADGQAWETAFPSIQAAIDAAVTTGVSETNPAEVWVAEGKYSGSGDSIVVMAGHVHLYGGFAGTETERTQRDWQSHPAVIHGEGVRRCVGGASNATLDGFVLKRGYSGTGGGMYNSAASPVVENCTFIENRAGEGGAMYNNPASSPSITNCTFSKNVAFQGGGIYNDASMPVFANCAFVQNSGHINGGGLLNKNAASSTLTNCIFAQNSAERSGGGIYNDHSSLSIMNGAFTGNAAEDAGGGIYSGGNSSLTVTNTILWGDLNDEIANVLPSSLEVTFSCVQGGYAGEGNTDLDPLFMDGTDGGNGYDLRLHILSPCINAGNDAEAPAMDFLGITRPQYAHVDMGAYEYLDTLAIEQAGPVSVTMSEEGNPVPWLAPQITTTAANPGALLWSVTVPAEHGSATVSGTGPVPAVFYYQPEPNYHGNDAFTVQVANILGDTDAIEVLVTVESVDDAPVISLLGDAEITHVCNTPYTDPGATATDIEDGDLSEYILHTGSVDTTVPGNYILTYDVTDTFGNPAVPVHRTVIVDRSCIPPNHTADQDADYIISLSELLRVIQFFNSGGFHCETGTEDSYAPGPGGDTSCTPHHSDYNPQNWSINLSELLRIIQFFNMGGYHSCEGSEDGFCPGAV